MIWASAQKTLGTFDTRLYNPTAKRRLTILVAKHAIDHVSGLDSTQQSWFRDLRIAATASLDDRQVYFHPRSEAANYGLRFQIAFLAYAIAAIGEKIPAAYPIVAISIKQCIDRFMDPTVWKYWLARGPDLDPVGPANVQYSGHLAQLIGSYERFSNDGTFDVPFQFQTSVTTHVHTHATVAAMLARQMNEQECRAVPCEPGTVYVACMDHAAIGLRYHDAQHGTDYAGVIEEWNQWAANRMIRKHGGVFAAAYLIPYDFVLPVSVQVMDTWSLAFLSPVAPELFQSVYRRWRRLARRRADVAWVAARWPNADLEVGDVAQNTAFGYVAAREAGDTQLADRFRRFAENQLGLVERHGVLRCWNVDRWLMISALFALGDALTPGAMRKAVAARPEGFFQRPAVVAIEGDLVAADWNESGDLVVACSGDGVVTLTIRNSFGDPVVSRGELLSVRRSKTGGSVVLNGSSPSVRLPPA